MDFDWTDPSTWTLRQSERIVFARSVLTYCDNAASKYPDASRTLATLREVTIELADLVRRPLGRRDLDEFCARLCSQRADEGTGFDLLFRYVTALRQSLEV